LFVFQAEDGIRDLVRSRGLGDVYKRQVDDNTSLEDIYNHLALLNDIELSEDQEKKGQIVSHDEVEKRSSEWLK